LASVEFLELTELSVVSFKLSSVKMSLKLRIEKMSLKGVAGVVEPSFDKLKLLLGVTIELSNDVFVLKLVKEEDVVVDDVVRPSKNGASVIVVDVVVFNGKRGPTIGLTFALTSLPPSPSTWTVLLRMTFRSSRRDAFDVKTDSDVRRSRKGKSAERKRYDQKKQTRNRRDMVFTLS